MRISVVVGLRRILNSSYDSFHVIPKQDKWLARERLNRFTAWQYGSERTTVKGAYRKQDKLFSYLDMQRRDEAKLEKHYAQQRVEAALAEHRFEYKHFRNMLDKAHILLDNVVLSHMAIYEPKTFQSLVSLTREMATKDGRSVIPDDTEFKNEVYLDESLFGEPFTRSKQFRKGAAENHTRKPRKLTPSEF